MMKVSIALFASLIGAVAAQDCFNTTQQLLIAQDTDPLSNDVLAHYTMCPCLEITVGFPANEAFTSFSNGDFPFTVLRPNTTIDGNGVVVKGGLIQFATIAYFALNGLVFADPKAGTIIKNFTFDGTGLMSVGGLTSQSMFISAPGDYVVSNVNIVNVTYAQEDVGSRPIYVGASNLEALAPFTPPQSISFTLENSTFSGKTLSTNSSLFIAANQTIAAKNVVFSKVEGLAAMGVSGALSSASVENVCVLDSKFKYAPLTSVEGDSGLFSISGLYIADAVESEYCEDGENFLSRIDQADDAGTCSSVATVGTCFADASDAPAGAPTSAAVSATATTFVAAMVGLLAMVGV